MPSQVIFNIKQLCGTFQPASPLRGHSLSILPSITNAYLFIEDGRIADFGPMEDLLPDRQLPDEKIDASGRIILPCWCDSHTHLVFPESRETEFVDKIKGISYAEIAAKGGGILNSARKLREMSEDQLFLSAMDRLREIARLGTGSVEIKSGYGLSLESELKMLRVIRKLKSRSNLNIRATFLGAHAIPPEFAEDKDGYVRMIIEDMLPAIAREKLADYIDVFCEKGFFSPEQTKMICIAGKQYGLLPKIHANQLHLSGGVEAGIAVNALSVDHLECMDAQTIAALSSSDTIGTLLPTAAFFLRMDYPPARQMILSNCAIALASDYNPGSSPSGNMNFVVSMACIQMRMLPEEAINAATVNGAFAMGSGSETGSITVGKRADLIMTRPLPSVAAIPYSFGNPPIEKVMIAGEWV